MKFQERLTMFHLWMHPCLVAISSELIYNEIQYWCSMHEGCSSTNWPKPFWSCIWNSIFHLFQKMFFFFKIRILWNLVFLQADIPNTSLWCGGGAWSWRMWAQTILIASCLITNPGNSVNTENTNKGAFLPLNKYCFW